MSDPLSGGGDPLSDMDPLSAALNSSLSLDDFGSPPEAACEVLVRCYPAPLLAAGPPRELYPPSPLSIR